MQFKRFNKIKRPAHLGLMAWCTLAALSTTMVVPVRAAETLSAEATGTAGWGLESNWEGGGVPGSTDDVTIDRSHGSTASALALNGNQSARSLTFGSASGEPLGAFAIVANNTGTTSRVLSLTNGTLAVTSSVTGAIIIGNHSGDAGVLTLDLGSGTGNSAWTVATGKSLIVDANITGSGGIQISGGGAVTLSGANTFGTAGVQVNSGGNLNINSAGALGGGRLTFYNGSVIDNTSGGALSVTVGEHVHGFGNLRFSGSNDLTLGGGWWLLGKQNRVFQIDAGTLTINQRMGDDYFGTDGGVTKTGGGTLVLGATNNTYGGTGGTTITEGVLSVARLANGGVESSIGKSSGAAGNLTFNGGTLKYTGGDVVTDRAFTINSGKTAVIDTAHDLTLAGATGTATSGALRKIGEGVLTLSGKSLYTGETTVAAGTLLLSGAGEINSTSNVTVASGAAFINDSATSFTRTLTLGEGGSLGGTGEFAPTAVTVTADLSDGFGTIALGDHFTRATPLELALGGIAVGTYTLFSGSVTDAFTLVTIGGVTLSDTGGGNFSGEIGAFSYQFTNSTSELSVAAIPEPRALAFIGLGLGALLASRRRRH